MKGYKTSKDYKLLKQLLDENKEVICFVTWDFYMGREEKNLMVTDICMAKHKNPDNPKYEEYTFVVRGHVFGDHWPSMDKWTFEELCESMQVEFIEPTE